MCLDIFEYGATTKKTATYSSLNLSWPNHECLMIGYGHRKHVGGAEGGWEGRIGPAGRRRDEAKRAEGRT